MDARVVDVPMAYNPTFVMLSSLKPLFFNSLKKLLLTLDIGSQSNAHHEPPPRSEATRVPHAYACGGRLDGVVGRPALGLYSALSRSLEEFDRIAIRVLEQDLLATRPYDNIVAEA